MYPQVLERDRISTKFQEVISQLEQALGELSIDELDISDEVKEQVEASFKKHVPF